MTEVGGYTWLRWGVDIPETRYVAKIRIVFEVEDEAALRKAREEAALARMDPDSSPADLEGRLEELRAESIEQVLEHLVPIPQMSEIPGIPSRWIAGVDVVPRASPEGEP